MIKLFKSKPFKHKLIIITFVAIIMSLAFPPWITSKHNPRSGALLNENYEGHHFIFKRPRTSKYESTEVYTSILTLQILIIFLSMSFIYYIKQPPKE